MPRCNKDGCTQALIPDTDGDMLCLLHGRPRQPIAIAPLPPTPTFICEVCGAENPVARNRNERARFCSIECRKVGGGYSFGVAAKGKAIVLTSPDVSKVWQ